LFLVVAPGVVAGLVPWWLTGWEQGAVWPPLQLLGALLIVAGVIVLVNAFVRFAIEGIGTPPLLPPQRRSRSSASTRSRPWRTSSGPSTRNTTAQYRAGGRGFGPGAASAAQRE
jgi:hypothetical protein